MYVDDRTRERMRRKTIQRLENESKKDNARRASLQAADEVWKSCFMSIHDMTDGNSSDHNYNHKNSQNNHMIIEQRHYNNYHLSRTASKRLSTSVSDAERISARNLALELQPPAIALNTLEYWSDDDNEDEDDENENDGVFSNNYNNNNNNTNRKRAKNTKKEESKNNHNDEADDTNSGDHTLVGKNSKITSRKRFTKYYTTVADEVTTNEVSQKFTSLQGENGTARTITASTIASRTSVETAAQRGWNRGSQELNESLLLPHADQDELDLPSIETTNGGGGDNDSLTTMAAAVTGVGTAAEAKTTTTGTATSSGANNNVTRQDNTDNDQRRVSSSLQSNNVQQNAVTNNGLWGMFFRKKSIQRKNQQGGTPVPVAGSSSSKDEQLVSQNSMDNTLNRAGLRKLLLFGAGGGGLTVGKVSNSINNEPSCSDAWMCGVCGIAFSSELSAEQHEWAHIEQLVCEMGYNYYSSPTINKDSNSINNVNYDTNNTTSSRFASTSQRLDQTQTIEDISSTSQTPQKSNVQKNKIHGHPTQQNGEIFGIVATDQHPDYRNGISSTGVNENINHSKRVVFENGVLDNDKEKDGRSSHNFPALSEVVATTTNLQHLQQQQQQQNFPKKSSLRKSNSGRSTGMEECFPGIEADIPDLPPSDFLVPRTRSRSLSIDDNHDMLHIPHTPPFIIRKRNSNAESSSGIVPIDQQVSNEFNWTRQRSNSEVHFDDDNLDTVHLFDDEAKDYEESDNYDPMSAEGVFRKNNRNVRLNCNTSDDDKNVLLLSTEMRSHVLRPDEALVNVILRAEMLILTKAEREAEHELLLLAKDKRYYDEVWSRAAARQTNPSSRYRSDAENVFGKVHNKLLDAYQLMKDSDGKHGGMMHDQYNRKRKRRKGGGLDDDDDENKTISHIRSTLYVNVMVKNSIKVVQYELQRLAKQRWESSQNNQNSNNNDEQQPQDDTKNSKFHRFRGIAQTNMVKLAGLALASDFTPRRIAIQMSNDLYRLLTPRLKRRGVVIATEIEYRVGPYFVLAINIESIDWRRLIKATYRDVMLRKARWMKTLEEEGENCEKQDDKTKKSMIRCIKLILDRLCNVTTFDILAHMFALLFHVHWIVYLPICWFAYYILLGASIRHFIISSVTDEIFFYVEEKGMEMEIKICRSENQAAFMLSALRELRADDKELKKKQQETDSQEKGNVLGPYLGPAIKADKLPPSIPDGFEVPSNLEFVGLELDLPVGFRRLRWALLSQKSQFNSIFLKTEAKYDRIVIGEWDKFGEYIGEPNLPDSINPQDFIGAEKEQEALMPKSAFVSANMSYEKATLIAYNDYCFCVKKKTRNPDAPFGNSFVAWTQILVVDTGSESCHLTCSVEPEFPNGPPMVANQIRSGMRAGTGEIFVLLGSTITKYADEYP